MSLRMMASAIANNAMLYKDLTQWLRSALFVALHHGLLFLGLAVCLLFSAGGAAPGDAGLAMLNAIQTIIFVYMLILAGCGWQRTAREIGSGIYDLYTLTGIRRRQVIWGKLHSLLALLLFGLFCLIPFMFFSFLQGGVDFFQVLGALAAACFWAPPMCLFALALGLRMQANISLFVVAFRFLFMAFLVFAVIPAAIAIVNLSIPPGVRQNGIAATLIKGCLALDGASCVALAVIGFFYAFLLRILYYACSNSLFYSVAAMGDLEVLRFRRACIRAAWQAHQEAAAREASPAAEAPHPSEGGLSPAP